MNMDDQEIIKEIQKTRNLKDETMRVYIAALDKYVEFTGMNLQELIDEADMEEEERIRIKRRKIKSYLIDFRTYLYEEFVSSTAKIYFSKIKTFYRHYEIELPQLPSMSFKNVKKTKKITFQNLPTREIIKRAIKISGPLMKAIILFITSSGCARNETLSISIADFINATKMYHNREDIYEAIDILKDRDDVIPLFYINRGKTDQDYYACCSPEAVTEIINYLLTWDKKILPEDKLFQINKDIFMYKFRRINDMLGLGKIGAYRVFRSHMLRKWHSSMLFKDGMNQDVIHLLQGRKREVLTETYLIEDPNKLRELYIKHMNSITINLDVNNIDIKSPEYIELETKYENEKRTNEQNTKRIDRLESLFKESTLMDKI